MQHTNLELGEVVLVHHKDCVAQSNPPTMTWCNAACCQLAPGRILSTAKIKGKYQYKKIAILLMQCK